MSTRASPKSTQKPEEPKKIPIRIEYTVDGKQARKDLDSSDKELLKRIAATQIPDCAPNLAFDPNGEQFKRDALHLRGITTVADFYTRRNLIALATLWDKASQEKDYYLRRGLLFV